MLSISIKVDKGRRGGQQMWITNSLVGIFLTSTDVDKGGGGK